MTVAQGINKLVAYRKQVSRGTAAIGAGGQLLRRETLTFSRGRDTYSNNEIASHQQSTGDTHGVRRSSASLSGVLSGGTYADMLDALLRRNRTAVANLSGLSLTLATYLTNLYKVTRATGSYLTDGIKIGQVVRLTGMNAANNNVNMLVIAVTATVLTVRVLNGKVLTTEGPIAAAGVTIAGKVTFAPTSGHTNDWFTFEEWFSDVGRSHLWQDQQPATAEIGMPATGNVTFGMTYIGLGSRVKNNLQQLTAPSAETTSSVVASTSGAVIVNGLMQAAITSSTIRIDATVAAGEATIGSDSVPDTQRGRIKVTGTFTALYEDDALAQPFDDASTIQLLFAVGDNQTDNANFIAFALNQVKIFSDDADDGEKQIVRTYNFTAEIPTTGGAGLPNERTIIQIHDSLAS